MNSPALKFTHYTFLPSPTINRLAISILFLLITKLSTVSCISRKSVSNTNDSSLLLLAPVTHLLLSANSLKRIRDLRFNKNSNSNAVDGNNVQHPPRKRKKRGFIKDPISHQIDMYLKNETFGDTTSLRTVDFITRMHAKYEYTLCNAYIDSVDIEDYFKFDDSLVWPDTGDDIYIAEKACRINKTRDENSRYRMYGEECNATAEREFWEELFLIASNDTKKTPKASTAPDQPGIPLQPEDYDYLQHSRVYMMKEWNNIWIKYHKKMVCNQKLLLECLPPPSADNNNMTICQCRQNGIGRPTITGVPSTTQTTQYYYDYEMIDEIGNEKRIYGEYSKAYKCALTVYEQKDDGVKVANPCDLFLPMIGVCQIGCVVNASCSSVGLEEKEMIRQYTAGKDADAERRIGNNIHDTYHNKCTCPQGKICHKLKDMEDVGTRVHPSKVFKLISFTLTLLSFHFPLFFLHRVV